jgi:uncharacterized membrane protein YozB (DUF420 family)
LFTAPNVILALKVAVVAVTVLLVASLAAIAAGRRRLHGRINTAFFTLTVAALILFEVVIRFLNPTLTSDFDDATRRALTVHLGFSIPAALLLPVMLFSGLKRRRSLHLLVGSVFLVLWAGTFVTGVFFLPHGEP